MHSKCTLTEQAPSYPRELPGPKNKTVKQTEQNSLKNSKQYIFWKDFIKIAMLTMPIIGVYGFWLFMDMLVLIYWERSWERLWPDLIRSSFCVLPARIGWNQLHRCHRGRRPSTIKCNQSFLAMKSKKGGVVRHFMLLREPGWHK